MCQASPLMRDAVKTVEKTFKSAVFAGIVPDPRHLKHGGYHVCFNHLVAHGNADDYSNRRKLDESTAFTLAGRGLSCASDVSLSRADMMRLHANVRRVYLDHTDPRRKLINAINCWDGSGDAVRYDFQGNTAGYASPDHKSHTHGDFPRAYVDAHRDAKTAAKSMRAWVSVVTGEAKAVWVAREEPKPAAAPAKPPPPVVKPKPITYKVVAGDTLWAIGRKYNVAVTQLKTWNGLKSDTIAVGSILRLAAPPKPTRHTVVRGDTLWEISQHYRVSVAQIKAWNGLKSDTINPGQVLRVA
jgi:LysM repeat protein